MNVVQHKISSLHLGAWVSQFQDKYLTNNSRPKAKADWLAPLRNRLDNMEVKSSKVAHRICQLIPSQCPFERKVKVFGRTLVKIPPMCKLNPLYNEVIGLRFRAICYLADVCGEDVSVYC